MSGIFVKKGWGYEKWITNTEKYCGKILYFNLGNSAAKLVSIADTAVVAEINFRNDRRSI